MANIMRFMREVKQESLKVTWPTGREVAMTTVVVLVMVAILSVLLLLADSAIAATMEFVLGAGK